MKQTKIKYQKMDNGEFKIVDCENIGTKKDIAYMLGIPLFKKYAKGHCYYFKRDNNKFIVHKKHDKYSRQIFFEVNDCFTAEQFNWLITTMKAAGERLTKIRKERERQKSEIREIVI